MVKFCCTFLVPWWDHSHFSTNGDLVQTTCLRNLQVKEVRGQWGETKVDFRIGYITRVYRLRKKIQWAGGN